MLQKIAMLANSTSSDMLGGRLIKAIKKLNPLVQFIGYGGRTMEENGLHSLYDISKFQNKPFHLYRKILPTRSLKGNWQYSALDLVQHEHSIRTKDNLNDLKKDVLGRIIDQNPSYFISIDNELLSWKIYKEISNTYFKKAVGMPERGLVNRLVRDYTFEHREMVDHLYFTVPKEKVSQAFASFPSSYIGHYGAFDALKFIVGKDFNAPNNAVRLSKEHAEVQIDKEIMKQRKAVRQQYNISDDSVVMFVAPGSEEGEANFCIDACRNGIQQFILKYSSPTSLSSKAAHNSKFVTVISLLKGSTGEAFVDNYLAKYGWQGRLIVHKSDGLDHLPLMAASDYGMAYSGAIVGQAVALHLPCMIMHNMKRMDQFFHYHFNIWWDSMTLTAGRDIYPELIGGQAWFGKITDTLGSWYINPDTRTNMIFNWRTFLKQSLPYAGSQGEYDEFIDPFSIIASRISEESARYFARLNKI